MATPLATRRSTMERGFTLIEVLFSVLILGVLIGLLFVAFRTTRRYAASVTDRQAVNAVKMGVSRFIEECGIAPPLVRDRATASPRTVVTGGGGTAARFSVYDFSPASTDMAVLRDVTFPAPSDANPFADARYSERSLPVYLAGACEYPMGGTAAADLPIDGVRGPGFYKANADGTFDVPATLRVGGTPGGRTGGSKIESLLDASKSYLQVVQDPADPERVELLDSKKVPVRFYRWVNGAAYPQGARTVYEIRTIDDLRLPPMVGRKGSSYPTTPLDRDLEKNPELRDATWAIVAAGPDGAFGDEPLALLSQRLGRPVPAADERKFRVDAEKDNVVEVGR